MPPRRTTSAHPFDESPRMTSSRSSPPGCRRRVLLQGLAAALATPSLAVARSRPRAAAPAVEERPLSALASDLAQGRTTSQALVAAYLDRIARVDRSGPRLNSVIALNPDAPAIARERDDERRRARQPLGPLHGMPIMLKDNIDTGDRMATTVGSLALAGVGRTQDAALVQRLRAAGAVILGKSNLSGWANIRSSHSASGWSAVGGLTRNPHALDRNTSGSSSGSAVAVAASLCAAAVGTETDGSILSPSSTCGIVGFKPTLGVIDAEGIAPIAPSQDTAGPMARNVLDAALLLDALAASDVSGRPPGGYAAALQPGALRGARLGVVRRYFGFHPGVAAAMEPALEALKRAGAELVDPVELAGSDALSEPEMTVLLYELKHHLNRYLARLPAHATVRSLADVIAFNRREASRELRWFGQDLFEKAQAKGPLTDPEYLKARETCVRIARTEGIAATLERHGLHALVAPTGGPAWRTDLVAGDHYLGGSTSFPAVAGWPSLTVPAGWMHGLPLGMNFFGPAHADARLLGYGFDFERVHPMRRRPAYRATIE